MTNCYTCSLPIDMHAPNELRKCLKYLGVHQEKLDDIVDKLVVLIT